MLRKAMLAVIALAAFCASAEAWRNGQAGGGGLNTRAQNIYGVPIRTPPARYYNPPGAGNPATSLADYYHIDGVYWIRPYDLLDSACGSAGVALAAARGRYIWIISPDHPSRPWTWDASQFRAGFSNDPGILPATADVQIMPAGARAPNFMATSNTISNFTSSMSASNKVVVTAQSSGLLGQHQTLVGGGVTAGTIIQDLLSPGTTGTGGTGDYITNQSQTSNPTSSTMASVYMYQAPWFVCNPDDATFPFYIYAEGNAQSLEHQQVLARCDADLVCALYGVTHPITRPNLFSSFQRVVRSGAGSWYSTGSNLGFLPYGNSVGFALGKYTSSDGLMFLASSANIFNFCVPVNTLPFPNSVSCPTGSQFFRGASQDGFTVSGQAYAASREDANVTNGSRTGASKQYVSRVPIGADFGAIASPAATRISNAYGGAFPGPSYLQDVGFYSEGGIGHYYAQVGYPVSRSNTDNLVDYAPFLLGGGLWEQQLDYYTEVIDSTAAASAAPIGVTASCAAGTATISWYDALPHRNYRVYKGSSAGTQSTLVGDVTGISTTDTPTANAQTWYKVVTLNGGEQGNRVVHTYCSSASVRVNAHTNRVLDDGGDAATINSGVLTKFDDWMQTNNRWKNLQHLAAAPFGLKCVSPPCAAASQITAIYDFGTTRLPRGGDLRPRTSSTTYQPTTINSTSPGWVNANSTANSLFGNGRANNIRRKIKTTMLAVFSSAGDMAPITSGATGTGIKLARVGSNVEFLLTVNNSSQTATKALGACTVHIIGGTFDGTSLYAWYEGVKGTANTSLVANADLGLSSALRGYYGTGLSDETNIPILQSGALASRYDYSASAWPAGFVTEIGRATGDLYLVAFFDDAFTDAEMLDFANTVRTGTGGIGAC